MRLEAEGFRVFSVAPPRAAGHRRRHARRQGRHHAARQARRLPPLQPAARRHHPRRHPHPSGRRHAPPARAPSRACARCSPTWRTRFAGGMALSSAFAAQGPIFPRIYTASILAGERSGALDDVLSRYVSYMRRGVEIRRKIRGALAYPLFLLAASMGMVMFLTVYVVPKMSSALRGLQPRAAGGDEDRHRRLELRLGELLLARADHRRRRHRALPLDARRPRAALDHRPLPAEAPHRQRAHQAARHRAGDALLWRRFWRAASRSSSRGRSRPRPSRTRSCARAARPRCR